MMPVPDKALKKGFLKNKLILVCGHSATGKSTFAYDLSHKLGIPCFSKDRIIEAMGDGFGPDSGLISAKNDTQAVINIMIYIANSFLIVGKPCILEANFRSPHDDQLNKLINRNNTDCLTFLFTGDLEILWERYVERETERHWALKVAGQNKDRFIDGGMKSGFGDFSIGKTIKTDATDFNKIDYTKLYDSAKQFLDM